MAFASKVLYTGDGATTQFTITFPFLSSSHVSVFVNDVLQLNPMNYTQSGTTITFSDAPGSGAAIVIRRATSPNIALVDFQNGSVLSEQELDTAYLHNFYLGQEYADSFNELINSALVNVATGAGIVETETDEVIAALVNEMLNDASASTLLQRVNDIDANGEAIVQLGTDLQVQINTLAEGTAAAVYIQATEPVPGVGGIPDPIVDGARWYDSDDNNAPYIYDGTGLVWVSIVDPRIGQAVADISVLQTNVSDNAAAIITEQVARSNADTAIASELALLGAQNGAQTAFILDTSTVKIDSDVGDTLATRFTSLQANIDTNASSIVTEQTARVSGDSANASSITALSTTVDGNTATIATHATSIDGLEAKYSVEVDAGRVGGFILNSTGARSDFVIIADHFAIVDPGTFANKIWWNGTKLQIDGDLMVTGTINGTSLINGTIGTTQIGANAITTTQLNASAVTAAKIATNAVTADKINVSTLNAVTANTGSLSVTGTLTMGTSGKMLSSGAGFESGAGFFLGYDTSAYKFYVGNVSTGNYMSWDGTDLTVSGIINVGEYIVDTTTVQASAPTERSHGFPTWSTKKTFTLDKDGDIRVYVDLKKSTGLTTAPYDPPDMRVTKNSVHVAYFGAATTTYAEQYVTVLNCSQGDVIDIDLQGGTYWSVGAGEAFPITIYVKDAEIRADVSFSGNPTVNLN